MHMIDRFRIPLVVVVTLVACGPEANDDAAGDWMLGVFSDRQVGDRSIGLNGVTHHEFLEDGTLLVGGVHDCAENLEATPMSYVWTRNADGSVEVELPDTGSGIDAWRFTRGPDCPQILFNDIRDGQPLGDWSTLNRGAVCLADLPEPCPEGTSCSSCEAVWCDEPPDCPESE